MASFPSHAALDAQELLQRYQAGERDFEQTRLIGGDLQGAILHGIDLSESILTEANFSQADLRGADLGWADLGRANLRGANLQGAILNRADLSQADLSGANLYKADLELANLSQANLEGTVMPDGTVYEPGLSIRMHSPLASTPSLVTEVVPESVGATTRSLNLAVILPYDIYQAVMNLPDRANWLRRVIIEAVEREILQPEMVELSFSLMKESPLLPNPGPRPQTFATGSLVRDPNRQLGQVVGYDAETGRYQVNLNDGTSKDYPEYLLTFVSEDPLP